MFAKPTFCSYGFDDMTLYTEIDMEPIPIHCDSAISEFTITPALPEGMTINPASGTISGRLATEESASYEYTVTATNSYGSVSTSFTFKTRTQRDMVTKGMIGCYWNSITECRVPDFDFFYKNPAQLCQTVGSIHFTDNNVDNTWPGLDRRFVDYYSAYFYSYIFLKMEGEYEFRLSSDDGAFLYIDDLEHPFISREACRGKSETKQSGTFTRGRHLLIIRFFEFNQWASLYVKVGSVSLGIETDYVQADDLRVGGRGPTFISYPFIGAYENTDSAVFKPELSSGAPVDWSVSPALPAGMNIDPVNGYISGRPSGVSSGEYTVKATGVNGVASAKIRVVVTSTPINGFRATYYKVTDTSLCQYPMLAGNTLQLSQIDKWSSINTAEKPSAFVWPGAPSNFNDYFYMEWEGFLYMNEIGSWKLRLTCDDGCKLIGADEQQLINHWGCHYYSPRDTSFPVSKIGYYYFRVEYQQANSNKGIKFEWKSPHGAWEVVPERSIFYVPVGVLTYKSERTHYYKDVEITDNVPVFFGESSMSGWSVHPALPAGLSLNRQNGRISGTPTETQVMSFYTITANVGSRKEQTVVGFDVQALPVPTNLVYMYQGSLVNPSSVISLVGLREMSAITISNPDEVTVSQYSINPALPEGLTMNESSGRISGKPLRKMDATVFSVTASNAAGSMILLVTITVSGCQGPNNEWTGEFLHIHMLSGYGTVSLVSGSAVQQCSLNTMKADGSADSMSCTTTLRSYGISGQAAVPSAVICVNPTVAATAKLQVSCNELAGCRWQVSHDDGMRFPYRFAYVDIQARPPYLDEMPYPTTLTPLSALTASSSEITVYAGKSFEFVSFTPNGCYKEFTFSPALPGATIDPAYPLLSGVASGSGEQMYTVTATGSAGTASTVLRVRYAECNAGSGRRSITFQKTTMAVGDEESWRLLKDNQEVFNSGRLVSYMQYSNTFCLEPGEYVLELLDSWGDGWKADAYLKVFDENESEIGEYILEPASSGQSKKTINWTLEPYVTLTEWKALLHGRPDKKWNQPGFDASAWSTVQNGNIGSWSQNGIYFLHHFTLDNGDAYPIVEFGVYYKDGCAVYLNGNEVYRRNLPSTTSSNTPASATFDGALMRVGTAPGYMLKTGDNVIAVELHRMQSTQGAIDWSAYVSYSAGDCVLRSVGGTITKSQFYNKEGQTAQQAWDGKGDTQWIENGLPAWTVYSYNFDHVEWINRITVGPSLDDENRDPAKFTVYGSNDGVGWDRLYSYEATSSQPMFDDRSTARSFMMMDHMNSYGKYKFEINKSRNGVAQVSVSMLKLEACRLVYCPKDGDYPGTHAGHMITIDCPEGYIGERHRRCEAQDLKPSWEQADESECRSKYPTSKDISYIDTAYAIAPIDYAKFYRTDYMEGLRLVVSEITGVNAKNVEVWKSKDITSSFSHVDMTDMQKAGVYVRITADNKDSSKVLRSMAASEESVRKLLLQYFSGLFDERLVVAFYMNPELNQYKGLGRVNGWIIFLLVVLFLIVASVVAFYLWTRLKNKKSKNGSRKLTRAGVHRSGIAKESRV